ncbi:MAG TPA: hypothetical protein VF702_05070 [Allosphingosinicella sp.]|jgi:hypothetical protein
MAPGFLLAALAFAQPAEPAAAGVPREFALACSLVGREDARVRFSIAVAGQGDGRRFAIRPQGQSRWIGDVTAIRPGRGDAYHFVSGGTAYVLKLTFDPQSAPLTANAELSEDRGFPALNRQLAEGSCRGAADGGAGDIPQLPQAPEVRGEAPPHRPVPLREGRVPTDCTIVTRDLTELRFTLLAAFDAAGVAFTVTPVAGQAWPASPFTVRGASLAALMQPPGGPPGGVMTVFAAAGGGPNPTGPAQIGYQLRAEPQMIEAWVELRSTSGSPAIVGAGHCGVQPARSAPGDVR